MKNISLFGLCGILIFSITAIAGTRIENRDQVLAERVVRVSKCQTKTTSLKPFIQMHFTYVTLKQRLEVYKVEVKSTSWWSPNTERLIEGSRQPSIREFVDEKTFPSIEECNMWVEHQEALIKRPIDTVQDYP